MRGSIAHAPKTAPLFLITMLLLLVFAGSADAEGSKTYLPIVLNGQSFEPVLAVVRDQDILVRKSDLEHDGLRPAGKRETIDGIEFVSLSSLRPKLSYKLDEATMQLHVDAPAEFFAVNQVDLRPVQPPGLRYGAQRGGYLNYALSDTDGRFSAFEELAATNGHAILSTSGELGSQGFTQGITSIQWHDRDRLLTTTAGDAQLTGYGLASNALIAGVTVARDVSLNPYVLTTPPVGFAGTTARPATAFVYANGILVKTIDVPPGPFDFNNIPVPGGSANVNVVLRDAFGNTTTLSRNFYIAGALLDEGRTNYSYSLGILRDNAFGGQSESPSFAGSYQLGVTNMLTAGGTLEGQAAMVSGGPLLTLGSRAGQITLAAAGSSQHGQTGSAAAASYSYVGPAFGVSAGLLMQSPHFSRLSLDASADRVLHDATLTVNTRIRRLITFGASIDRRTSRDSGADNSSSVFLGAPAGRNASLIVTASRSYDLSGLPQRVTSFNANLIVAGRGSTSEQAALTSDERGATTTLSVQKPVSAGVGFGYLVSASSGSTRASQLSLDEQTQFADVGLDAIRSPSASFTSAVVSGSLATLGTGVVVGRPVDGAFAVVQAQGAPNLPVYLGGEYQGITDRNGRLLVPSLTPNFGNDVNVDIDRLPQGLDIKQTRQTVAPFAHSGLLVKYGSTMIRAITGTVVIERGGSSLKPAYTNMTLDLPGGPVTQGLGDEGVFYFENVPQGSFKAHVDDAQGGCTFILQVPSERNIITNLGTVLCDGAAEPGPSSPQQRSP